MGAQVLMKLFRAYALTAALALWVVFMPRPASAQELLDLLREARTQRQAEQLEAEFGPRPRHAPPAALPYRGDTLLTWIRGESAGERELAAPEAYLFDKTSWRMVRRLQRNWFRSRFDSVQWAYLGNSEGRPVDTTWTRELRGRLESRFGQPTRTLLELDRTAGPRPDEYIQFEYWLVLNDTIPLIVMDTGGPFDRGVVVAADGRFRSLLGQIRHALWLELAGVEPAAYVDYYYDAEERAWYRTGYEGSRYTTTRIKQPNLARGRPRPGLE